MKADKCRACHSSDLEVIYDFGPQPLAGYYPTAPESVTSAERYPLDLSQCLYCGLLQVTNLPPVSAIFHSDYRYSSSTVPALVAHFEEYARYLGSRLEPGASVLEFGCNDGVLLAKLRDAGFDCVGVDASENVAEIARGKGLQVISGFLTLDLLDRNDLTRKFDAVTCSNVFAHIDDLHDTLAAVRALLKPGGLFFVEVHDGDLLASEMQFDTIYHEHLTYFTEATLRFLVESQGFTFVACDRTPMHGGGLRFSARYESAPSAASRRPPQQRLDAAGLARTIERCRDDVLRLSAAHGPLYGYGAAGRSQMFLNMTDTGHCFAGVFDDSPFRQHRYIVGSDIPILPYSGEGGECCNILAWNYAPSIAPRLQGKFRKIVTLLPEYREWAGTVS